jgi:uncharacterized protein YbgA (DUF1722 family)/uncharacterized protein YbbK (DUF523 family)
VSERREPWNDDAPVRIGISACLLGREVRFDGGHKRDPFLNDVFAAFVEWVPVCPEVELGLGIPRETLRLERDARGLHLVAPKSGADHTRAMARYAAKRVAALEPLGLCGYVLKKDSPSCGMERVKVYPRPDAPGRTVPPVKDGRGAFASRLLEAMPLLPVEEEGRLHDPRLRENFVERVFAYRALRRLFAGRWTTGDLVAFHTARKLTLLAHSPEAYRALGRLVAGAKAVPRAVLRERYETGFMQALRAIATTGKHANVLQHAAGHFKRTLDAPSRAELAETVEDYRRGLVPLVVPITLLRHHARRTGARHLEGQTYLAPHPKELMLRNHV